MKITINELVDLITGVAVVSAQNCVAESGYCGDFLSFVISKVPDQAVWFTVMNNANVAAVAKLGEVAAVVICDGVRADERLIQCCKNEEINLIETKLSSFECAFRLGNFLQAQ
ncbi:MAG: hypothetical protein PHC84_01495 [Clostridia bacterium]|nr:hypothetical protein [Clostridia bacterium]